MRRGVGILYRFIYCERFKVIYLDWLISKQNMAELNYFDKINMI